MIKGGEDFFKDTSDDFSSGGGRPSFRDISPERIPSVEKIFQEVLGRKPSSRELSFYKYTSISEDEIRTKLLSSDEHLKILEDASKLDGVEDQFKLSQLNEKKLTQRVEDLENQIAESNILLGEKNKIIAELREKSKNPYDLIEHTQRFEEGFDIYGVPRRSSTEKIEENKSIKEKLKDFINILLK